MHGLLPALLQAVAYHSLAVSLPAFPVICLLIVHVKISPLPFTFSVSTPSACASFQFIVYCVGGVDSVCLVALVYPRGGCGNTMLCLALTCLVCWMSPKLFCRQCLAAWEPSCFLNVTWHAEAFYGLGVQDVEVLILLCALFPPSVAPAFQQGFWFTEQTLSASVP
jgi:hypothetical protein